MSRPNDFAAWLRDSRAGDTLAYHVGHLALDRYQPGPETYGVARTALHPERVEIDETAVLAWEASEEGLVILLQRRDTYMTCTYIAVRTAEGFYDV